MAVATIRAEFSTDLQKVWKTVTSLENWSWRSDLSKIEVLDDTRFVEYTKDGYATMFTVTAVEPYQRWEFDVENDNIRGHWTGVFTRSGEKTEVDFTEEVQAKKVLMKPFVKAYLRKQQAQYIADLKKALL